MPSFSSLSSKDRAKIDQKLAELQAKTGRVVECFVMRQPQGKNEPCLLEITIDGRSAKPIVLEENGGDPVERLCAELEEFFAQRAVSSGCLPMNAAAAETGDTFERSKSA